MDGFPRNYHDKSDIVQRRIGTLWVCYGSQTTDMNFPMFVMGSSYLLMSFSIAMEILRKGF